MNTPTFSNIVVKILVIATVAGACLVGCNSDVDPQAPVEAPGYYNGPMEPRGKPGSSGAEGEAGAAGATAGATGK